MSDETMLDPLFCGHVWKRGEPVEELAYPRCGLRYVDYVSAEVRAALSRMGLDD